MPSSPIEPPFDCPYEVGGIMVDHGDVEYGREFDNPMPDDDVIPWLRVDLYGPCPERGTINGHPWHRVMRYVVRTTWTPDA